MLFDPSLSSTVFTSLCFFGLVFSVGDKDGAESLFRLGSGIRTVDNLLTVPGKLAVQFALGTLVSGH